MPSEHDPADSLADIIENAERVERYMVGMDRDAFAGNGLMRDAVERCMERVCEAAHRLGERAIELMPSQPWGDIRGMYLLNPVRARTGLTGSCRRPDTR